MTTFTCGRPSIQRCGRTAQGDGMRLATRGLVLVGSLLTIPGLAEAESGWVATWAASPQAVKPGGNRPLLQIDDQTVRERVRVSVGGSQVRIRLSNDFGSAPLLVGSATV